MSRTVECVVPSGDRCGEGAVWHARENAIYWADINRFLIHCHNLDSHLTRTWQFKEPVTALMLTDRDDVLVACLASRIVLWSSATGEIISTLFALPTAPAMRCNDARVAADGTLWMGTMKNNVGPDGENLELDWADGVLYCIKPDGIASERKTGIGISNTVVWSPDQRIFYFGDTPANIIRAYDYDAGTAQITRERSFFADYKGLPDGSTIDADGCLWVTRPQAGLVVRVSPEGTVLEEVILPVPKPTTCVFGGADLRTLFVTSATSFERLAGCLSLSEPMSPGSRRTTSLHSVRQDPDRLGLLKRFTRPA